MNSRHCQRGSTIIIGHCALQYRNGGKKEVGFKKGKKERGPMIDPRKQANLHASIEASLDPNQGNRSGGGYKSGTNRLRVARHISVRKNAGK